MRYPGENWCGSIFVRGQPYHWISRSVKIAVSRSVAQGSRSLDFSSDLPLSGRQPDRQPVVYNIFLQKCTDSGTHQGIFAQTRTQVREATKAKLFAKGHILNHKWQKTFATYSLVFLICPPHDPYVTTTKDHTTWGQTDWRSDPIISHLGGRRGR